jgi:tetratricopeptide (TPR) repeat protein/tRNA A-37 threonylcarbamoyl transferase component Bud32
MSPSAADRNLLFGILALQLDFISRDQLIRGLSAWVQDKTQSMGRILVAQRALTEDLCAALETMVEQHIEVHGNDPQRSLETISSFGSARRELAEVADADVQASLGHVPDQPVERQAARSVGATTSGSRFRILRPHAKGGLGQVSVAHDEELNRDVALKEVQERFADNPVMRTRFVVEAEITGGLEHPGIVPVYGLGHYPDGRPFYAMRFIRGDSLKEALRRFHDRGAALGGLEFRQLLGRFVDVCNAVAYAHSRGVLHRDLKPGNIMLGKFGETLVVDWGLAKVSSQEAAAEEGTVQPPSLSGTHETVAGTAVGTAAYMSPEQAAGELDLLGPASDIYSLGATLYVLLTGKVAFTSEHVSDIRAKVRRGDFPAPRQVRPAVPAALDAICQKAMALDPPARYGSALDLAADIEHWLADEPVSAWTEPWTVKLGRWVRRHKPLVSGAVAAVLVALFSLTAGAVWYQKEQARRATEEARQATERALRQEYLNKEVRLALDEASQKSAELQFKLEDPRHAHELLGDIDQWQTRLHAARAAWLRAQTLAEASPDLVADDLAQLVRNLGLVLAADESDWALARDLENVRLEASTLVDGKFDYGRAAKTYPQVFTRIGLHIDRGEPAAVAAEIVRSRVRYALVAALDHWAHVTPDPKLRQRVLQTVRQADPHPWRDRFRDAKVWDDLKQLETLARERVPDQQSPQVVLALAARLRTKGGDPVPVLRNALVHHARDFWLYFDLGNFAVDPMEKVGCFQAALAVRPNSGPAYINLGNVLRDKKDFKGAVQHYARAIDHDPGNRMAHLNLGNALFDQKDVKGAIEEFKKALECDADYAMAHYNLGTVLRADNDLDGAIKHLRRTVELEPTYALAHNNLGNALFKKKDLDGAVKHLRKAIELDGDNAMIHYNLGNVLSEMKERAEAISEFRAALKLNPNHVNSHGALGRALLEDGQFADARQATVNFLKLLPAKHPMRGAGQQQLKKCDELIALDRTLAALVDNDETPTEVAGQLALAKFCRQYKRYHAVAVSLYAGALAAEPATADDLAEGHRFDAARSAALAAAGKGLDPRKRAAKAPDNLRGQALDWLRADLVVAAKQLRAGQATDIVLLLERLPLWQTDGALAGVRDADALAALPEKERQAWRRLWVDADALLEQARARVTETTYTGTLTDKDRKRAHELKLCADKTYIIEMHSTELDSFLKLLDATGKLLAQDDDISAENPDARLIFTPKTDGTFRVVATSYQEAGRGAYTLTIRAVGGAVK